MSKDQPTPANGGPRPMTERPAAAPFSGAGGAAPPPPDGFLSSLADLESRINLIKSAHEQAAARDMDLSSKEATLAAREQDLTERERSIAARMVKAEAELTRAQRELAEAETARMEAAETLKQVASTREQEAEVRAKLEQDRTEFADEQQRLEQERQEHEFDLKLAREEIERERAGVAEHARTLAEQMKRSDDEQNAAIWSNRLEAIQIQMGESNAARARLETELAQTREDVESLTQELIEANNSRGVPRDEVERRDKAIAELTTKVEEATAATTMLQQQVEHAVAAAKAAQEQSARVLAEREKQLAEREQAARQAQSRLTEIEQSLGAKSRELDEATKLLAARDRQIAETGHAVKEQSDRAAAIEAESDTIKKELSAARELLDQAEAAAKSRVPEEEVRTRDAAIAGLQEALREAERSSAELSRQERENGAAEMAELSRRLAAAEEAATQLTGEAAETVAAQARERNHQIEELQARLEAAQAALDARVPAAELARRDHAIAELNAKLEEATEQLATQASAVAPSGPDEDTLREIARRDEAITILKERLDEALARPEQSSQAGPSDADYRRRDRLRRYKTLLQTQARKIVSAQTAIQRRHADCEAVLQNRSKLVALAQQLARAEKKITANKSRSGAAAAVLYFTATLSILAVMSWEVSKRTWPGTYIARAVLEAETGRAVPKAEDMAAWQKDHAELLSDPRLMEVAAQRMQQRGLTALGTPAELASRLKQDMYVQSSKAGSLTVELRGEGAEKTALILDTLVTAFKSVSDQGRDERTNDLGVIIAQAATPGAEPLLDKRIEKAGGVFAGAALAAGLAGLVIWSRLVRAKRKFDRAGEVEAALGDVSWATLEASIKQNAEKNKEAA